jgi:hypothetical protein
MKLPENEAQPQNPGQDPANGGRRRAGGLVEIRVSGHLDSSWSNWLGDLQVRPTAGGETLLTGHVEDQAALRGILEKLYRANIPLMSINPAVESETEPPQVGKNGRGGERAEVPIDRKEA